MARNLRPRASAIAFPVIEADDEPAAKARAGRGGDAREIGKADTGLLHRRGDDVVEALDMRPRRDLGHDPAEGAMLLPLRAHDVGEDFTPPRRVASDDGCGGLVAARLDAEHQRPPACAFAVPLLQIGPHQPAYS